MTRTRGLASPVILVVSCLLLILRDGTAHAQPGDPVTTGEFRESVARSGRSRISFDPGRNVVASRFAVDWARRDQARSPSGSRQIHPALFWGLGIGASIGTAFVAVHCHERQNCYRPATVVLVPLLAGMGAATGALIGCARANPCQGP
ncbi:MAG: hypothetical protein IT184_06405 [Acidobacteria bacterium]|nr:hypothetical protein [Acidobacteriota bacterium]